MQASHLVSEDKKTRKVSTERAQLLRLQRRRPTCISARALLLSSLLKTAQTKRKAGVYRDRHVSKKVVANHVSAWDRMSYMDKNQAEARSRQGAVGLQVGKEA